MGRMGAPRPAIISYYEKDTIVSLITACDDPLGIKKLMQPIEILEVEASGVSPQLLRSRIEAIEGVVQVSVVDLHGDRAKLSIGVSSSDAVAPKVCKEIIGTGGDILLVNRGLPSLEDSFLRLTKGAGA